MRSVSPSTGPDADAWACAPLDVPDFATQICASPDEAASRLRALSPAQRLRQALGHAAWFADHGIPVTTEEVHASYALLLHSHLPVAV